MKELQSKKGIWIFFCSIVGAAEMLILCVALFQRFSDLDLIVPILLAVGAETGLILFVNNIHVSFIKLERQIPEERVMLLSKTEFSLLNDLHLWHSVLMSISFVCLGIPWWIAVSVAKLACLWLFVKPKNERTCS